MTVLNRDDQRYGSHGEAPALIARREQRRLGRSVSILLAATIVGVASSWTEAQDLVAGQTTRVSVATGGTQGNGESRESRLNGDGRIVVFYSVASNLVPNDTNGVNDVFVHDRQTGETSRVSISSAGAQGNGASFKPSTSADGRFVAFESTASNLVTGDTNGSSDTFVHDRQTGVTTRVSVASDGAQANVGSFQTALSADGRFVAFASHASNLIASDTNGWPDIFIHDRQTSQTTRVSVSSQGAEANRDSYGPRLSSDGRFVTFHSAASNLVATDTNAVLDVFVHDRQSQQTRRVSIATDGTQGNNLSADGMPSADGRYVAFISVATNLVAADSNASQDSFVHDLQTGDTTRAGVANSGTEAETGSASPAITDDARLVAFASTSSNLVSGDGNGSFDVFVRDRQTGQTALVSVAADGSQGNNTSILPSLSADGHFLTFTSFATNLVPGDTNSLSDVFVVELTTPVGTPPTAINDAYTAPFNTPVNVPAPGVLANDNTNGGGVMTALLVTNVTNGTLALAANGSFTYTPAAGFSGAASFTYRAVNSAGNGNVATVTITVAAPPPPSSVLPPTGLQASSIVGNVVTLRWTPPTAGLTPTSFALEGGVNPGQVLASIDVGSASPAFTFTAPTGAFYVRVHTLAGASKSAASNEIRIFVGVPTPPSAPENLLGLAHGTNLTLAWRNTYGGGAPTGLLLDVVGSANVSVPLSLADTFTFAGVPGGSYTFSLRATNAAGVSGSSPAVSLTFPSGCSGVPLTPQNLLATRTGNQITLLWDLATSGPAPTGFLLTVSGSFVGTFPTTLRSLSGAAGPGSYTFTVSASNPCGNSPTTAPQTVVIP